MVENTPVRNVRRTIVGVVTSDKSDKTIKVMVERQMMHPIYGKRIRSRATHAAHDEKNEARIGDTVEIAETRRLSKQKCWRLVSIRRRAE